MSWAPDLFIGEFRPWPNSVYVVRGKSDESRRYVPEDFSAISRENVELRELVRYIMHQCNDCNPRCGACINWNCGECVALLRMRELGIEVG